MAELPEYEDVLHESLSNLNLNSNPEQETPKKPRRAESVKKQARTPKKTRALKSPKKNIEIDSDDTCGDETYKPKKDSSSDDDDFDQEFSNDGDDDDVVEEKCDEEKENKNVKRRPSKVSKYS